MPSEDTKVIRTLNEILKNLDKAFFEFCSKKDSASNEDKSFLFPRGEYNVRKYQIDMIREHIKKYGELLQQEKLYLVLKKGGMLN